MRRITAILLTLSFLFSSAAILATAQTLYGDVNSDGKITAADARNTLRASAKLDTFTEEQIKYADVDFNSRISAADARLILRVSAKLDTIEAPEDETTTVAPETTTKEPETTTKEPEETTEPLPEEGIVVEDYPEAIDAFFDGTYYLDGQMTEGSESVELKMATARQKTELAFALPGTTLDVSLYVEGKKTYMKFASGTKKHYVELTDTLKDEFGDMSEITGVITSIKVTNPGKPILTKGIFKDADTGKETECDIYTFASDEARGIHFYAIEDKVIQISLTDSSDVAMNIIVNELTKKAPSNMLTLKGYSETSIAFIPMLYPEFSGGI